MNRRPPAPGLLYWLPALFYMLVIFYFSSYPAPEIVRQLDFQFLFMKSVHIIEYGVLGILVFIALKKTTPLTQRQIVITAVLFTIVYGISDEIHQSYIHGRSALIEDVVTDGIGGWLGTLWASYFKIFGRADTSA